MNNKSRGAGTIGSGVGSLVLGAILLMIKSYSEDQWLRRVFDEDFEIFVTILEILVPVLLITGAIEVIIGIVFLVIGDESRSVTNPVPTVRTKSCPSCGRIDEIDTKFCSACGYSYIEASRERFIADSRRPATVECVFCGKQTNLELVNCEHCGRRRD